MEQNRSSWELERSLCDRGPKCAGKRKHKGEVEEAEKQTDAAKLWLKKYAV
jgi:hypothetical protein